LTPPTVIPQTGPSVVCTVVPGAQDTVEDDGVAADPVDTIATQPEAMATKATSAAADPRRSRNAPMGLSLLSGSMCRSRLTKYAMRTLRVCDSTGGSTTAMGGVVGRISGRPFATGRLAPEADARGVLAADPVGIHGRAPWTT
jgi:hypothetical protein